MRPLTVETSPGFLILSKTGGEVRSLSVRLSVEMSLSSSGNRLRHSNVRRRVGLVGEEERPGDFRLPLVHCFPHSGGHSLESLDGGYPPSEPRAGPIPPGTHQAVDVTTPDFHYGSSGRSGLEVLLTPLNHSAQDTTRPSFRNKQSNGIHDPSRNVTESFGV